MQAEVPAHGFFANTEGRLISGSALTCIYLTDVGKTLSFSLT
jgi:hypothetical protein